MKRQTDLSQFHVFFQSEVYPFSQEGSHQFCKTVIGSFARQLPLISTTQLVEIHACKHVIALKKIVKVQQFSFGSIKPHFDYFLTYQRIPYGLLSERGIDSIAQFGLKNFKTEILSLLKQLCRCSVYFLINCSNIGVSKSGQIKVFIPPLTLLKKKALSGKQLKAIIEAAQSMLKQLREALQNRKDDKKFTQSFEPCSPMGSNIFQISNSHFLVPSLQAQQKEVKSPIKEESFDCDLSRSQNRKSVHPEDEEADNSGMLRLVRDKVNYRQSQSMNELSNRQDFRGLDQRLRQFQPIDFCYPTTPEDKLEICRGRLAKILLQQWEKIHQKSQEGSEVLDTYQKEIVSQFRMPKLVHSWYRHTLVPCKLKNGTISHLELGIVRRLQNRQSILFQKPYRLSKSEGDINRLKQESKIYLQSAKEIKRYLQPIHLTQCSMVKQSSDKRIALHRVDPTLQYSKRLQSSMMLRQFSAAQPISRSNLMQNEEPNLDQVVDETLKRTRATIQRLKTFKQKAV